MAKHVTAGTLNKSISYDDWRGEVLPPVGEGLATKSDIFGDYIGAAKLPSGVYGSAGLGYGESNAFYYDSVNNSIFAQGINFSNKGNVGEIALPTLSTDESYSSLPSGSVNQNFIDVLSIATSNSESLDYITGIRAEGDKLIVNAIEYYDAAANNTTATFVLDGRSDLSTATVKGAYSPDFAARAAGWMVDIPAEYQTDFGGDLIAGYSLNEAITSRFPVGVSAYGFNKNDILNHAGSTGSYSSTKMLDYVYTEGTQWANAINSADPNTGNSLYTLITSIRFAFVVPGTRTYCCVGMHGGELGLSYKGTNDAGEVSGGNSPDFKADKHNYYWLFDLDDMIAAKGNDAAMYEILPYEYGEIALPFQEDIDPTYVPDGFSSIVGADFDVVNSDLYIMLDRKAGAQRPILKFHVG